MVKTLFCFQSTLWTSVTVIQTPLNYLLRRRVDRFVSFGFSTRPSSSLKSISPSSESLRIWISFNNNSIFRLNNLIFEHSGSISSSITGWTLMRILCSSFLKWWLYLANNRLIILKIPMKMFSQYFLKRFFECFLLILSYLKHLVFSEKCCNELRQLLLE